MTAAESLARGAVLGFAIAAPVGPIGVLCIRRTLADGRLAGFVTGLGAAFADGIYGAIAAFGIASLTSALVGGQTWVRLIGGVFLLLLGIRTFLARPAESPAGARGGTLAAAFFGTFALTITNPMTILSFAAVFAGMGLGAERRDALGAVALVGGVLIGSAVWWLTLSAVVGAFRDRFDARRMTWVNQISGGVLMAFGLIALGSLLPSGGAR